MRKRQKLLAAALLAGMALYAQAPPAKPQAKPAAPPSKAALGVQPATSYKNLQYPPLNKIRVPEPVRFELPNGMLVYLVEDHELPTISASALIRTGDRWEPVEKAGLASITGMVMRSGGTPTRKGDDLDQELDRLGAYVETGIGEDSGRAMISVLKEDIDKGLEILSDILQHPAFPEDKLELAKIQQREGIARRNDNPGPIAAREFDRVILGKDTAYGHMTEYDTIAAITREDLVAFHERFFQPENVILGVWGDFDTAGMRAKIEKAFGGWERGGKLRPPVPEVDPGARNRAGVYYIKKEDVNQSTVYMGFLGGKRSDPDYFALTVADTVLGGAFSSRLMNNVRSELGLAYSVGAQWAAGWDRPGVFRASGGTKSETTVKMVKAIRADIAKMGEGVSDNELSRAKDMILKGAAFDYDSTGKIVERLLSHEYYGYPLDYLQRFQDGVRAVTRDDVARVSKEYLTTDRLAIVVLGNDKQFDQPLSELGEVTAIDITIPPPKGKALGAATPEAATQGKALLAAAREAMGGAALMKVKDLSAKGDLKLETPQGPMALKVEASINFGGKIVQKMQTPMGEMVMGFDGRNGWMRMGANTRDMPDSQRSEAENTFFRETIPLLQNFDKGAYTVQALGPVEVDGRKADAVAVSDAARKLQVKIYIDPETKIVTGKQFTAAMMGPPVETEEIYSDYRDVDGVKLPFKTLTRQAGKPRSELTATDVKLNPGVEDSVYQKPAATP